MNKKPPGIHSARVKRLNEKQLVDGEYVLYWMQQSQREEENHALEYAIGEANRIGLPVVVCFGLMDDYPEANLRHYAFLLEGLRDVRRGLENRGIQFVVRRGTPPKISLELGLKASLIVCDMGYLRHQREWREMVAYEARCGVLQVEGDVIVPVETASDKREYAARTFRPKVTKKVGEFIKPPRRLRPRHISMKLEIDGIDLESDEILEVIPADSSIPPISSLIGGTRAAKRTLTNFISRKLENYATNRSQPQTDNVSHMSKYLHFGHISPAVVARAVQESGKVLPENRDAYLDELIVRRELTCNFVYYTPDYDKYSCIPEWARRTLDEHRNDPREYHYTLPQLERGETHDRYWNAAMKEMRETGYMHNYMRMYWGKKILEWSLAPEDAYRIAIHLNNKYFIDGRDPNSFANVGWIFGLHDRPWQERKIFGKVRIMTAKGLERKADPEAYVKKIEKIS